MARTPKQIASSRRRRLLEKLSKRDGNYCRICGGPLSGDDVVELDHRVPLCRGGANVEANLQLAHRSCNRAKAGRRQVSIHVILDDLWARLDAQQETINALMACIEDYIVMRDRT
jgi:5-methylcytosine-specific restriction endonuclease McrA